MLGGIAKPGQHPISAYPGRNGTLRGPSGDPTFPHALPAPLGSLGGLGLTSAIPLAIQHATQHRAMGKHRMRTPLRPRPRTAEYTAEYDADQARGPGVCYYAI